MKQETNALVDYRTWTTAPILDKLERKSNNDEFNEDILKYKAVYSKGKNLPFIKTPPLRNNTLHLGEKRTQNHNMLRGEFSQKTLTNEYSVLIGCTQLPECLSGRVQPPLEVVVIV